MAELSGTRTGPLAAGERITLTDPKGRRHSVVLREAGVFHTTKGAIAYDDLIGGRTGTWSRPPAGSRTWPFVR